jgi:hypothetical protein
MNFIADKEGNPIGIQSHIGRRPIAALATPTAIRKCFSGPPSSGPRSCLYVHHTEKEPNNDATDVFHELFPFLGTACDR